MKLEALSQKCHIFYKAARKIEDLAILQANIGKYIHFSNSDRLGINYGGALHPGNPKAVYGFPFTAAKYEKIVQNKPDAFYDYGYNKYIYIFDVTGNILDMDNLNLPELASKVRSFILSNYPKGSYHTLYGPTPGPYSVPGAEFLSWLNRIAEDSFKNSAVGVNVLLRGIGYDAMLTMKYGFGDDIASEIAVLNPSCINLVAKIKNPMLTKEQVKEIEWYESQEYRADQALKQKEREDLKQKQNELLEKHKQKIEEEHEVYEKERQLLREKKFDEAIALRQKYNEKWKDLQPIFKS